MIDTNVLISAFVLSSPHMQALINAISEHHTIVLPTYVLDELKRVTKAKFPNRSASLEAFLHELPFELVYTPENLSLESCPNIRDPKDLPILLSAIKEDVDILLSGDSDFAPLDLDYPEILTPRGFVKKYC